MLDIDDTCDVVHGHQQLSLFNAHYDERCFLPIHVYDTETLASRRGRAAPRQDALGRRGARSSAPARAPYPPTLAEDAHHVSRRRPLRPARGDDLVRGQRRRLRVRPSRHEAAVEESRRDGRRRAHRARLVDKDVVRGYAETRHRARSWRTERRAVARIEATRLGLDIRFIVTNLERRLGRMALRDASIARAARPRISSSCTRRSSPPTARRAARRSPTRFASSSTPPPTG